MLQSLLWALLVLFLCVRWLENRSIFYPTKEVKTTPGDEGMAYEDLTVVTPDGVRLQAWFVPAAAGDNAPGPRGRRGRPVLIYCHGNAGNIGMRTAKLKVFHDLGLNVLLFDYRGYGKSTGRPTEQGVYRDALAVYDYLAGRANIDKDKIAAYGASLGGAVVIDLATKRRLAGLVVDSSFTSALEMAGLLYPYLPGVFMSARFDSVAKVKKLTVPKLFIHTRDDATVPFYIGKRLFEAALPPKVFTQLNGVHGESSVYDGERFQQAVRDFFIAVHFLEPE